MKKYFLLSSVLLFIFANSIAAQTVQKAKKGSLVNELAKRETTLWEGWKTHQAAPFQNALSWDTVLVSENGIAGKEESIQGMTATDCNVQDYALSDFKVTRFSKDVALLTYNAVQHVTCGGVEQPVSIVASSLWIKRKGKWYAAFHQETPGR